MNSRTKHPIGQRLRVRLHQLVIVAVVLLTLLGRMPESQAGRPTCPPQVVRVHPPLWRTPSFRV
ncbi:MAG: hypothetical protein H5T61_06155 [Thermoflexales bacterium]|nr:hypothetical protein [Thermoflexales bacterium]